MAALTETGDKAKGAEVVEEVASEEVLAMVEEGGAGPAGSK